MLLYLICMLPFIALGYWAQNRVGRTYAQWGQVRSSTGLTGAQMARQILDRNGLQDVDVLHVPGTLSDHYSPVQRTVNLSDDVFNSGSVSAVSVAAHEVGHAIQHQKAYAPFRVRSSLAPAAQFGSSAFFPLFFIGALLEGATRASSNHIGIYAMLAGIILFALAVLFQLVTLPVEFDASRRAKQQLGELNVAVGASTEAAGTAKVLNAAAMTYVVAALGAVVQLAYFVLQFLGARR